MTERQVDFQRSGSRCCSLKPSASEPVHDLRVKAVVLTKSRLQGATPLGLRRGFATPQTGLCGRNSASHGDREQVLSLSFSGANVAVSRSKLGMLLHGLFWWLLAEHLGHHGSFGRAL